jgi:hypothetical protein
MFARFRRQEEAPEPEDGSSHGRGTVTMPGGRIRFIDVNYDRK